MLVCRLIRYQYNGVGETGIWHSSRNYLVVDLSAGPSTYGPLVSSSGAVTPQALPSIKVRASNCLCTDGWFAEGMHIHMYLTTCDCVFRTEREVLYVNPVS